jgi:hypothetical protein
VRIDPDRGGDTLSSALSGWWSRARSSRAPATGCADRALLEALDQLGHEALDHQRDRGRLGEAVRAEADDFMRRVLATPEGRTLYRHRQVTIEPVFGQLKFNRQIRRFQRRGRAACRLEWRLIAATHNRLKLYGHRLATVTV